MAPFSRRRFQGGILFLLELLQMSSTWNLLFLPAAGLFWARFGLFGKNTLTLTSTPTVRYTNLEQKDFLICLYTTYERHEQDGEKQIPAKFSRIDFRPLEVEWERLDAQRRRIL